MLASWSIQLGKRQRNKYTFNPHRRPNRENLTNPHNLPLNQLGQNRVLPWTRIRPIGRLLRGMVASPEIIQAVIDTYRRSTQANVDTALRQGNVIVITPDVAEDVMVTTDLHGNRINFNRIREIADLDRHERRHLVMQEVCHGGPSYPTGGGCMSHTMLEDIAELKVRYGDRFHFLLSNHELAELTDFPIMKSRKMLNLMFRCGLQEMYGDQADNVRDAATAFIASCPLAVRCQNVFICHSAPENAERGEFDADIFDRVLEHADFAGRGHVFELVWGRDFRAANARAFAQAVNADVLIHGHEPCADGYRTPNDIQIIIDSQGERGCYIILPCEKPMTQEEGIRLIKRLW